MQCNILVWNCQGIVNHETQSTLISLVRAKNPGLLFLSENLAQTRLFETLRVELGFAGSLCYPCEEASRGVALMWKNDLTVKLRTYGPNHIDTEVRKLDSQEWWRFTGVCGFAQRSQMYRTWNLIQTLAAQTCVVPWLMAGDFNEIMSNSEKSGGPPCAWAPMNAFRQTMLDCELFDMRYHGRKFTWSCRYTKERLDRAFQSSLWKALYPFSRVIVLPPSESDHVPLLVEIGTDNSAIWRSPRRFRFEEMWFTHAQCIEIIQKGWSLPLIGNGMQQVGLKIQQTGVDLLQWHKDVFDAQRGEIRIIQEKLNDILRQPFSPSQFEEQKDLHSKLSTLLSQQETLETKVQSVMAQARG